MQKEKYKNSFMARRHLHQAPAFYVDRNENLVPSSVERYHYLH